ncbi:MAG: 4Fe-4S binding protein [Dehalococcoidia bacterium]|jgi:NADH-quinone oxidoreductase subunit I|nr:hypothetical protein [Chloroflexota bacterium]MDP6425809.1 4Fe-4S binding protein [Dehalococcoidia bacterium]MDP7232267.1 4Fe-4S binding protein [Dehalococcoidia bacterium]MDP7612699.1 4Fe-4S binding protein [Dehalococcoidia bacterium]
MIGLGLLKGLKVTLFNFIRKPVTIQYPNRRVGLFTISAANSTNPFKFFIKQPKTAIKSLLNMATIPVKIPQSSRFRGNEFTWFEDRCTGCASCAKFCPLGIIEIVTQPGGTDGQEGESYAIDVFDIDIGRCMFCGLCVEACPYDALHMGTLFERSGPVRNNLIVTKEELIENQKKPSSWYRPQFEDDSFNPFESEIDNHRQAGRHEKPSDEDMHNDWVNR